jgi:hypothetical protein
LFGKLPQGFLHQPFNPQPLPGRLFKATIEREWRRRVVGADPFRLIAQCLVKPQRERRSESRSPTSAGQRPELLDPLHAQLPQ